MHCRAGLGRTGTLIGLWLMRRAGFTARDAIAWLRIVRPGSVVGPQQEYLCACERRGWESWDGVDGPAPAPPAQAPVGLAEPPSPAQAAQARADVSVATSVASRVRLCGLPPAAAAAPAAASAGVAAAAAAAAEAADLASQVTAAACARGLVRARAAAPGTDVLG